MVGLKKVATSIAASVATLIFPKGQEDQFLSSLNPKTKKLLQIPGGQTRKRFRGCARDPLASLVATIGQERPISVWPKFKNI